ncbi:MAG: hypothetical protein A2583_02570 [Bdellovibrionales bacterium RIFOXYD1_FULL_53_11]|nr:MAG: hypothetical protein A2583_02570 [Bdellovibrionales bacterium RIFOXYD1_FULL_53_11]
MKLYVIGIRDTVNGFKLAGVQGSIDSETPELDKFFDNIAKSKEYGIVFLSSRTADKLRSQVDSIKLNQPLPIIFELNDQGKSTHSDILQFVKESVGIKL